MLGLRGSDGERRRQRSAVGRELAVDRKVLREREAHRVPRIEASEQILGGIELAGHDGHGLNTPRLDCGQFEAARSRRALYTACTYCASPIFVHDAHGVRGKIMVAEVKIKTYASPSCVLLTFDWKDGANHPDF